MGNVNVKVDGKVNTAQLKFVQMDALGMENA